MEETKTVRQGSAKGQPRDKSGRSLPRDFNDAWLVYVRALGQGQHTTEKRYWDAYYAYMSAIQRLGQELWSRPAEAYQCYAKATQEASGSENPQDSQREAHRRYLETLQETQQAAQNFGEEAYKTCATALVSAHEESRQILRNALRTYLQSLKDAWVRLDVDRAIEESH